MYATWRMCLGLFAHRAPSSSRSTSISASRSARCSSVQARARHSRPATSLSSSFARSGSSAAAQWYRSSSPPAPPRALSPAASAGMSSGSRCLSASAAARGRMDAPNAANAAAAAATGRSAPRSSPSSATSNPVSIATLIHLLPSVLMSAVSSQHACRHGRRGGDRGCILRGVHACAPLRGGAHLLHGLLVGALQGLQVPQATFAHLGRNLVIECRPTEHQRLGAPSRPPLQQLRHALHIALATALQVGVAAARRRSRGAVGGR
jgi:hypothetical protein